MKIGIIDVSIGNIRSIVKKLSNIYPDIVLVSKSDHLEAVDKLIFPGVGNYGKAMEFLRKNCLIEALTKEVKVNKKPILGICLGMQLFFTFGEEGNCRGLGWLPGNVIKFKCKNSECSLRIPHVGWNQVKKNSETILLNNIGINKDFYFTHSYHLEFNSQSFICGLTEYGYNFPSMIQHENIYGVQFHPEKSHFEGLKIIYNFLEYA